MSAAQQTILIVDDDADFAEAVSSFLEANHYRVLQARTGEEGMKLAKIAQPDLVLMDIIMSERTEGLFSVQERRHSAGLADVPVIVVSSLYTQAPGFRIAPEAGWMGHDEFLAKPVDLNELLEKIRRRLAAPVRGGAAS